MTISIWRYSHLSLAISSFLFIIIASLTGAILAFEPISNQLKSYKVSNLSTISVAETIMNLQKEYKEIVSIEVNNNSFVKASVITKEQENSTFYINPKTGKKLGNIAKKKAIFKFATSLHRSLFLKKAGRFFVGLVSFLLFLITITGTFLLIKRQGSLKSFFAKISNENFHQYSHVLLGRLSILPIIIITLTGVYLSLDKFKMLPKFETSHEINFELLKKTPQIKNTDFSILKKTKLSEVRKIEFPFSSEIEDYFLLELLNSELLVNQKTGTIISQVEYPFTRLLSYYSLIFHTGQGSIFWSFILLFSTCGICYFIYSGFAMTLQRRKGNTKNEYKKEECEYVILVGSENGNTKKMAKMLYEALLRVQKKVFITNLNEYTSFPKMKQLIVLTSTYGDGEAPNNAANFLNLIKESSVNTASFNFSVVAFGSHSYPKFCQFGYDVNEALFNKDSANEFIPITTVQGQSLEAFLSWVNIFSTKENIELQLNKSLISKQKKTNTYILKSKKIVQNKLENTFLLTFTSKRKHFKSGDLLGIYPNTNEQERLYSVARIENEIVLSVKRHELGICSNYLFNLKEGQSIQAYLQKNSSFHFPKKVPKVIMIATGTGIAPFLGMLPSNFKTPIDLYFGVKNKKSLLLYSEVLKQEFLTNFYPAFSRDNEEKVYVQNLIKQNIEPILEDLERGTVIMICGSVNMRNEVFEVLQKALKERNTTLSFYKDKKQILVDCY